MVLELLLDVVLGVIEVIVSVLFPIINIPQEFIGGIAGFIELIGGLTFMLPISTMVGCLIWVVLLHQYEFFMSVLNWLVRKIPGVS